MLPRANRVTTGGQFRAAVRDGWRAGNRLLVVHLRVPGEVAALPAPPTVGFVVSKAVGAAVTRNRVKRRLRHLVAGRLDRLPGGAVLVVRAQPASSTASATDLAAELDRALDKCLAKARG